jgi:hypothetical protein
MIKKSMLNIGIIVYVSTLLIIGFSHSVGTNLENNSNFSFNSGFKFVYAQNNDFGQGDNKRANNDSNSESNLDPNPDIDQNLSDELDDKGEDNNSDLEPTPDNDPEPEPTPDNDPEPEPTPDNDPEPEPTPDNDPEPEPTPDNDPEPEPTPDNDPEPEPTPDNDQNGQVDNDRDDDTTGRDGNNKKNKSIVKDDENNIVYEIIVVEEKNKCPTQSESVGLNGILNPKGIRLLADFYPCKIVDGGVTLHIPENPTIKLAIMYIDYNGNNHAGALITPSKIQSIGSNQGLYTIELDKNMKGINPITGEIITLTKINGLALYNNGDIPIVFNPENVAAITATFTK